MAIRKLVGKSGKATWQIDYLDPSGKRIRQMFKKKKDAQAELSKRQALISEGRYLDVKKECETTLGELAEKYRENFQDQASYKTFKKYAIVDILDHFKRDTRLDKIRFMQIETFRNHLRRKPTRSGSLRKESSTNREMACLRHMLEKAVEWDLLEKNPFEAKGRKLRLTENNQRLRYLSKEEIPRLRDACPPYLRNIVDCALNTGMRKGEILSLKWSQVRDGLIYLRKTKTNRKREIPVNDTLQDVFDKIKKYGEPSTVQRLDRKSMQFPKSKTDHIFTYQGEPIKDVKTSFTRALKKAGIENFRFHDLRHTFASHLVMHGASIKDVQELLGHADLKMTMRYAHLSDKHKSKAVNLLNGLTENKNLTEICHTSEGKKNAIG
jgi:integrase